MNYIMQIPQKQIDFFTHFFQVRASVRAINPKQVKYLEPEEKLDRHTFSRNLARAKVVLAWILDSFQVTK